MLLRVWIRIKHIYKTSKTILKTVTNIVWETNLYSQRPARRARSQLQKPPMTCFQLFSNRPVLPARSTCAKVKKFQFKGRTIPHNQPSATRIERTTKTRGKREERYVSSIVLVAGFGCIGRRRRSFFCGDSVGFGRTPIPPALV